MIATMASARERISVLDVVIATVVSALGALLMVGNVKDLTDGVPPGPDEHAWIEVGALVPVELAIPLFLLVTVPLLWRRVAPEQAVTASFAGLVVNDLLLGTEFLRCGVVLPTAALFAFSGGFRLGQREARKVLWLALGLVLLDFVVSFGPVVSAVAAAVVAVTWGVGRIARSRRQLAESLEARTGELREARDERARLEVATERARLSQELDELLQRRLAGLARLAGEGPRGGSDGATAALVEIEQEGRRTLDEMRAVVGVLRHDELLPATAPQPTLTNLEALLVRAKGADARLSVEGSPLVLPPAVELSAYRIVEQLLDALDDAPGVRVKVRFADDALELEVSGPARRRAKASIERARERARVQRGTLEATVHGGRAEAVVSLPVLAGA
jgi:signal transduction histidine kinase